MPAERAVIGLFRVRGIPVRAEAGAALVFALVAVVLGARYFPRAVPGAGAPALAVAAGTAAGLLLASLLVHELAHALLARRQGLRVDGITLHLLGGVSQIEDEPPTPRAEALIAAAGPVASLALAGAAAGAGLAAGGGWAGALLAYLAAANLVLGLFNLVPAFPLDGGRLLRAAAWSATGQASRATAIAGRVGGAVAVLLIGVGVSTALAGDVVGGVWVGLLGVLLHQAAGATRATARLRGRLEALTAREIMAPAPAGEGQPEPGPRVVLAPADSAWLAWLRMAQARAAAAAVVDGERVVGVVSRHDLEQAGGPGRDARERPAA